MIDFEHLKVYNIVDALRGMRNPQESWDKGRSYEEAGIPYVTPEDLRLAANLSRAGNDHAKFLRQIFVSVDIIAPLYFWKELSTYKVGTVANSTSMMHKLGSRPLTVQDFSFEDLEPKDAVAEVARMNRRIERWVAAGKRKEGREWRALQAAIPAGFNYRRTWTANYQVLKTIALSDRKNHKLTEWHEFISFFVNEAPYFNEFCLMPCAVAGGRTPCQSGLCWPPKG